MSIALVLLIVALVLLLLAAFNVQAPIGLFPLGMALWLVVEIMGRAHL